MTDFIAPGLLTSIFSGILFILWRRQNSTMAENRKIRDNELKHIKESIDWLKKEIGSIRVMIVQVESEITAHIAYHKGVEEGVKGK